MDKNIIINKFKNNEKMTFDEMAFIFNGYINKDITDEEMTLVLKSICKYGMSDEEIYFLTDLFLNSGDKLNLDFSYVDKHSTGGVGDKTTLIVAPIVASCGVKIAKMSGKALGHTGGTIDKLESIGVNTNLDLETFSNLVKKNNMAISAQTNNLCPMDKEVYALRDVTNTVKSLPLIAVSIMSKKIASGAKKILIDIKVGKGALIENIKDARRLAKIMINIGNKYDRKVICMLTRMDVPLGNNIGNSIEILEVLDILSGKVNNNLTKLCIEMSAKILEMNLGLSYNDAKNMVVNSINKKLAYNKFLDFVKDQGGNIDIKLNDKNLLIAKKSGYLVDINSFIIGDSSMKLGAGRVLKTDKIDYNAGIILNKNIGDYIKKGDVLCYYYGSKDIDINYLYSAFKISMFNKKIKNTIIEIVE